MEPGKRLIIEGLDKYDFYQPLEVFLHEDQDFLKIMESLTRIGIASKKEKKLIQSCHILHRQGRYWLVHFKELFAMSGRCYDFQEQDVMRRNTIALLLQNWGLLEVVEKDILKNISPFSCVKVIPFREKKNWIIEEKFTMNFKRNKND